MGVGTGIVVASLGGKEYNREKEWTQKSVCIQSFMISTPWSVLSLFVIRITAACVIKGACSI